MSNPIEIQIPIRNLSDSLEIYHQARLVGAVERFLFTEMLSGVGPVQTRGGMLLTVFFDEADKDKAMLFKLANGGAQ
ncbi:hypothetical protein QM996_02455 [Sinorhizobium chiapasense]